MIGTMVVPILGSTSCLRRTTQEWLQYYEYRRGMKLIAVTIELHTISKRNAVDMRAIVEEMIREKGYGQLESFVGRDVAEAIREKGYGWLESLAGGDQVLVLNDVAVWERQLGDSDVVVMFMSHPLRSQDSTLLFLGLTVGGSFVDLKEADMAKIDMAKYINIRSQEGAVVDERIDSVEHSRSDTVR